MSLIDCCQLTITVTLNFIKMEIEMKAHEEEYSTLTLIEILEEYIG